jgi:hypothetical protein
LAEASSDGKIDIVSIEQIEQAIEGLSEAERNALESRLLARRCGLSALSQDEQRELLMSLDEADREIDNGEGLTPEQVRERLREWIGK